MTGQLIGKYEIRGRLGAGAMGLVLDAFDPVIGRRAALKLAKKPEAGDAEGEESLARFRREAQAAGRLNHPHIVAIYDFGEDEANAWIAMELVEGGTLKQRLDKGERLPLAQVQRVMEQVLAALDYSHRRGVVHRDIKPANIMLTPEGEVKLADFGIARIENSAMTQVGTVMGTPAYMAPEQLRGETVDARADIWAAGVVLYQLLTGEKPFEGGYSSVLHKAIHTDPTPPSALAVTAPRGFDAVIARAMAKRPEDRWPSAAAFSEGIRAALAPAPDATMFASTPAPAAEATMVQPRQAAPAPAPSPTPPPAPAPAAPAAPAPATPAAPPRTGPPVALIGGGVAVLVAAGVGAMFLLGGGETPSPGPQLAAVSAPAPTSTPSAPAPALAPAPTPATAPAPSAAPAAAPGSAAAPMLTPAAPTVTPVAPQPAPATPAPVPPLAPAAPTPALPAPATPTPGTGMPSAVPPGMASPGMASPTAAPSAPGAAPPATSAPSTAGPAPPAPSAPAPPVTQLALAPPRLDFRAAAREAAAAPACGLIAASAGEASLSLRGVLRQGEDAAVRRALAARDIPGGAQRVVIQGFEGPYCPALDLLRPVLAPPDAAPQVQVAGNMPLRAGQLLRFEVTMPDWPGHLYVAYFMKSGEVAHLVPSARHAAGATVRLGEPRAGFPGWEVSEPFGTDLLVAVVSEGPLFGAGRPLLESQDAYRAALSAALAQAQAAGQRVLVRPMVIETTP